MLQWLRNQFAPKQDLAPPVQFYYDAAYLIFPCYALVEPHEFKAWSTQAHPAQVFARNAAGLLKVSPAGIRPDQFRWHQGKLEDGRDYVAVQYPEPTPVPFNPEMLKALRPDDLSAMQVILAPYFSLWVGQLDKPAGVNACFVLGQSPVAGQTTLRQFTQAGHYNRGPGPEPRIEALLQALKNLDDRPVLAGVVGPEETHTELDRTLLKKMNQLGFVPDPPAAT